MSANRRSFLKKTGLGLAGAAALGAGGLARAGGANNRLAVALIGCGGMGLNHVRQLVTQNDVQLAWICDPDQGHSANGVTEVRKRTGRAPQVAQDLRRVLDDRTVDAVFIATPDHWHGPATLLALAAGKHVYVEKPAAHNVREGRLMIEAARRQRKVVQVGMQSRSTQTIREAIQLLRDGAIGDVLAARVWNSQLRRDIGRQKPAKPPAQLDYDLWVGPAPLVPYQSNRLHSWWRWWFSFGTGDMGNDGVHDLDIARWGLNVETHPSTVTALGGKYFFDDDQEFPDTQTVIFEYPGNGRVRQKRHLIFEQRIWSPYRQEGYENGDVFYGTNGMLVLGKESGWTLYGPRNKQIRTGRGTPDLAAHHRNFFECVRNGRMPNADIEIGHLSATLCHLGNLTTRLGRTLRFDPRTEQIVGDKEANALVRRQYREGHWAVPQGV